MNFIWYNPDSAEYKYGAAEEFNQEIDAARNPNAYTVLMEFDANSSKMAKKIRKQLNLANSKSIVKIAP